VNGTERVHNDNEKGYSPSSTSDNWITRCDCLEPGGHDTSKRKCREEKEDINLRRMRRNKENKVLGGKNDRK